MTIIELLEAHHEANWNRAGRRECACGYEFTCGYSAQLHRAHVAELLNLREDVLLINMMAMAWDQGSLAHANNGLRPKDNPYRKESSDGC